MIKYYDYALAFSEFPDEVSICINLTNCPNHCQGCSEPWLAQDIGEELTPEALMEIIHKFPGATLVGFMGGDNDPIARADLAKWLKVHTDLKVGVYSGSDHIELYNVEYFDYYKIGRWIYPYDKTGILLTEKQCGPIGYVGTNQRMFRISDGKAIDVTCLMQKEPISDLSNFVIKGEL